MPPTVEDRLRDILEAITEIEDMLAGGNLGNVWEIVQDHLPPLKSFIERRIRASS